MMLVTLKIYYYDVFGEGRIKMDLRDGATLSNLFNQLQDMYGNAFKNKTGRDLMKDLNNTFIVFVNGTRISVPSDLGHVLRSEDEIVFVRPVSGG